MTLQLTRLEQSRLGAEDALEAARARQVAADAAWEGFLGGLGLVAGLSPATAREALERMDRVQALEAERPAGLTRSWSGRSANAMPSVCRFGRSCGSLAVCRMPARTTQRKSRIGPDAWKRCCANGSPPVPKTPRLCVSAPDPKNRPWKSGRLRPSIMTPCGKWNVSSIWRRCRCRGVLSEARGKAGTGSARAPP